MAEVKEAKEAKSEFWALMTTLAGLAGAGAWAVAADNAWLIPWILGSATVLGVAYTVARTFLKLEREKTINYISTETEDLIGKILTPVQALTDALQKKDSK